MSEGSEVENSGDVLVLAVVAVADAAVVGLVVVAGAAVEAVAGMVAAGAVLAVRMASLTSWSMSLL